MDADSQTTSMTELSIELQRVDEANIGRVEALLEANDLPAQDIRAKSESFFLATSGSEPVGCGGVEQYGSDGLLRSVVIRESFRGEGYGMALCDDLEAQARACGVETLYLLTTTASRFFRRRGYEDCRRDAVPTAIQATTEFAELCPSTATCLRKNLDW